jgi:hypothetical protein
MKLPVFSTFGNALGFAFGSFLTCLRLAWLPVTLLFVTQQAVEWLLLGDMLARMPDLKAMEHENPLVAFKVIVAMWQQMAPLQIALMLLQALVIAAVAVSIHRVILFGDRREGSLLNFSFGKTEFMYMLMAAAMSIFVLAILASVLLPAVYIVADGNLPGFIEGFRRFPDNVTELVRSGGFGLLGIAYLLAWILVIYVSIRLAVWPPSVVATGSLSPAEPWSLMRGNVWRFIGLVALCVIVLWILMAGTAIAIFSQGGFESIKALQSLDHQEPREIQQHVREQMMPLLPVFYLIVLLLYTFVISFSIALISYSYKALKGYGVNEVVPA